MTDLKPHPRTLDHSVETIEEYAQIVEDMSHWEMMDATDYDNLQTAANLLADFAAQNTRTAPKVKPLVWVTDVSAGTHGKFGNGLFNYQVAWNHPRPDECYWKWRRANSSTWYTGFHSPDAAKAAAQADYERRILSALTSETEK